MPLARSSKLDRPVDLARDLILGNADAELTLVEYGSYASPACRVAHDVVANLWDRFGERMRYVFRHAPRADGETAQRAAELSEYAFQTTGEFWRVHDALMQRGQSLSAADIAQIAAELKLTTADEAHKTAQAVATRWVQEDVESARLGGVRVTPTFFIGERRYEGPWDESTLAEAMLSSLGHRLHTAPLDFVRWGPSAGLLLLLMSIVAVVLTNSPVGPAFQAWWQTPLGLHVGGGAFTLPAIKWVNDGLLTIFFLVVGLEIKREFTVGRLATREKAALPLAGSIGGMIAPALIYLAIVPFGPLSVGWGVPIATDTAFAITLMVLLGNRVPLELRVFFTAAVILDDLAAIAILALFYSAGIDLGYLAATAGIAGALGALNHWGIYRPLPYAVLGVILWACLHEWGCMRR